MQVQTTTLQSIPQDDQPEITPIPGYEGYGVTRDGRIYSMRMRSRWTLLNPPKDRMGHPRVCLCANGKKSCIYVHRIVLQVFVGPCPDDMEACHNDGNPENNNVENLRWDTHHNNIIDKLKHGTIARKEKHGCAVLTEVQVVEIRKKWASGGYRQRDLADEYGVVQANIYYIVHGKTWKTSTNQEKS